MLGYDSLLGSHFDKYEIVYSDYRAGPVDRDMFKVNEVISKYLESHAFCQWIAYIMYQLEASNKPKDSNLFLAVIINILYSYIPPVDFKQ